MGAGCGEGKTLPAPGLCGRQCVSTEAVFSLLIKKKKNKLKERCFLSQNEAGLTVSLGAARGYFTTLALSSLCWKFASGFQIRLLKASESQKPRARHVSSAG